MGWLEDLPDRSLAQVIRLAAEQIEASGQPKTWIEKELYFQRYERFWLAMSEHDRRTFDGPEADVEEDQP